MKEALVLIGTACLGAAGGYLAIFLFPQTNLLLCAALEGMLGAALLIIGMHSDD